MKLINQIRIHGFRSIADEVIAEVGEHTVIVGKNSSGKSNVLRALNMYFNEETAPGIAVDFQRDLHYRPSRKQKKEIVIEIEFTLPEKFSFRSSLERLRDLGKIFSIKKTWKLDRNRGVAITSSLILNGKEMQDAESLARDFLSLITFRYVPNRTIPADVLKDESQVIAAAIFKKMKETTKAGDVLKGLSESAEKLLSNTSSALENAGSPLSRPNIAKAESLGEMLRMSGFQAFGVNGASVRDEDWGAGHQSFFLLNLLCEIDTDYSRQFGWKQACIWAVEEPESGLHHDLQTRLAKHLMEWSIDSSKRLQLFTTTHSPIVTMSGDSGVWVDIDEKSTRLKPMAIQKLLRASEEQGVSTHINPALSFPFNPVVLVEGPGDEEVLNHAAQKMGLGIIKFTTIPRIDMQEASGVDNMIHFAKRNSVVFKRRLREAPFIFLTDWEVLDEKINKLRSAYGDGAQKFVIRPSADIASRKLGDSFVGIERFYPEDMMKEAHDDGDLAIAFPTAEDQPWSVNSAVLKRSKYKLKSRFLSIESVAEMGRVPKLVELIHRLIFSHNTSDS